MISYTRHYNAKYFAKYFNVKNIDEKIIITEGRKKQSFVNEHRFINSLIK